MKKFNNIKKRYFITGTDTGAGKTVLSLLMMHVLFNNGYNPFYLKPLQTGCNNPLDIESDANFIYKNIKQLKKNDPADSVIFCFKNPKAPWFAARDEKKKIDKQIIKKCVYEKSAAYSPVIIEGAGGLLVPVDEKKTQMIDLIDLTQSTPVITARAGLGTINHTLLTIEALRIRGIKPCGILFFDTENKQPADNEMIKENIEAVETASGIEVKGVIGKINDFSDPFSDPFSNQGEKNLKIIEKIFA